MANIAFIVADDLGCYGGRAAGFGAVSPHIDALDAGGLRFEEGYANSPVCSPPRVAMMTLRHQYRRACSPIPPTPLRGPCPGA